MKKIFSILALTIAIFSACNKVEKIDIYNYEPNTDFTPAFNALSKYANASDNGTYDIEKTIRVMNSIELAQSQSEDFMSYLEYLSQEDFQGVAPEMLQAKIHLLPILQKMVTLQKQSESLNDIWTLAQCAAKGVSNFSSSEKVTEEAMSTAVADAIGLANPPVLVLKAINGVSQASDEVFNEYNKKKQANYMLQQEIESLRLAYIDYLTEYTPLYHKYMKEWDALCLKKDKAYLETYAGRGNEAKAITEDILKQYPNNREALLLNAIANINMNNTQRNGDFAVLPQEISSEGTSANENLERAQAAIQQYLTLYPDKSAPALVVSAMMCMANGQEEQAMSFLDQASIEYPKQSEELTDLLNSYKFRTYLNQTPEGQYLLRLYHSTMAGYGIFSPNIQKAMYYESKGDLEKSTQEIYNHFFRRGNQGMYDCLLSDMEFCEENLEVSFKNVLLEKSYLDLNIKPATDWKFQSKEDEISLNVHNRSDIDFENVRLFLCIHYTDMYTDEYDIVKSSTVNVLKHQEKTDFDNIKLEYQGKKYSDITRIRAIAMTDNKICWIDAPDYKIMTAKKNSNKENTQGKTQRINKLNKSFQMDAEKVKELLSSADIPTKVNNSILSNVFTGEKLCLKLPRSLTLLNPVFSINELQSSECKLPVNNVLEGSNILINFDIKPKDGETYPLYMYSDFYNCRIDIKYEGGKPSIANFTTL